MKILFITPSYLPATGGAERQTALLGCELRRRGHRTTILTEERAGLPSCEETDAGTVLRVLPGAVHPRFYAAAAIRATGAWLVRHGRRFDVVQCMFFSVHAVSCALLSPFFNWRWGARLACTGRFGELGGFPRGFRRSVLRWALNRADRLIALSGAAAEEMRAFGIGAAPITVLPNAVDTARFRCPNRTYEQCAKLLFVGRLTEQKNLNALLEALATPGLGRCRLTLAGRGEARTGLAESARRLGIAERVDFRGEVDGRELLRLYCGNHLFVLPSLAEGMSNALLEAMACGLPCVSTPVSGATDLIRDGENGVLAEDYTPRALSAAVARLHFASPSGRKALGTAARHTIEQICAVPVVAQRWETLFAAGGSDGAPETRPG